LWWAAAVPEVKDLEIITGPQAVVVAPLSLIQT
jgi:hypothetical protein